MEFSPIDLSEQELRRKYIERKAATPDIVDQVKKTVEIDGHQYDIEAFSINPYTLHGIETYLYKSPPVPLNLSLLQQFYLMQDDPRNYVGIVSQFREKGDRTYIRMYGSTQSNHDYLAGAMHDIGIPMEEITAANNTGLVLPFTENDQLPALVRYKFDMNKEPSNRYYHVWVPSPQHKSKEEVLQLRNRLVRASLALEQVIPEMAARRLKIDKSHQILKTKISGNMFREYDLELNEYTKNT